MPNEPTQEQMTYFDEIAEAIMEAENVNTLDGFGQITIGRLGQMLRAAARMGAEASTKLMPEHQPTPAMWVCSTCHLPVVLNENDEWIHA